MSAYGLAPLPEPCRGCDELALRGPGDDDLTTAWLDTAIGTCALQVHRRRACWQAARERMGGGTFKPERLSPAERAALETNTTNQEEHHGP